MPNRIRERDLHVPTLRAAASRPNKSITTSELIDVLEGQFQPAGEDAKILAGRHDSKFSQKVRNLISHRDRRTSIFSRGLAQYDGSTESIRLTERGVQAVK